MTAIETRYGDRGRDLVRRARGRDDRAVTPVGRPKSLSRESAFPEATDDLAEMREVVRTLAAAVADRASRRGAMYRTIGIKVVEPPFELNTRERSLSGPVDEPDLVTEVALDLLTEFEDATVRKLGVRVANLSFADQEQARLEGWDGGDHIRSDQPGATTTGESPSRARERKRRRGQAHLHEFTSQE